VPAGRTAPLRSAVSTAPTIPHRPSPPPPRRPSLPPTRPSAISRRTDQLWLPHEGKRRKRGRNRQQSGGRNNSGEGFKNCFSVGAVLLQRLVELHQKQIQKMLKNLYQTHP
jgi:hypothetical protein